MSNSETVSNSKNGLGTAALVLGIVGIAGSLIPFVNIVSLIIAIIGLVLGIIGLIVKNRPRGRAIAGSIICAAAIIIAAISLAIAAAAVSSIATSISDGSVKAGESLTYEVTSDSVTAGNVTYATFSSSGSGTSQDNGVAVPWTKNVPLVEGDLYALSIYSVVAQASPDATTITCTVKNGETVLVTNTSTGASAVVTCSGSAK